MALRSAFFVMVGILLTACDNRQPEFPYIENVSVVGPAPGNGLSVAYFDIHNPGAQPALLSAVRSPQFDRVEIHETTTKDGVARMRRLSEVTINAGDNATFSAGGRHLMLDRPRVGLEIDSPVTLEFQFADGSTIVINTTAQKRIVQ